MTMIQDTMIKYKKALTFRHELKHVINKQDDYLLTQRLRKIFKHDKYADIHGQYRVVSLYFDTPDDMALRQKIDGVDLREKFRLRYYNKNLSFIRLEKKIKMNGLCSKLSTRVSLEQVKKILNYDIEFLLESEDPLLIELYSKMKGQLLKPKTIVCYDREAFLYEPSHVRITLDRHLHTALTSIDFLNPDVFFANVSDDITVLEVKYNEFLPEIVQMAVQVPNGQTLAFSKYAQCRCYD